MTSSDTYTPFGLLPYTPPSPTDAVVLRDAAALCRTLAGSSGGSSRVDLTDRSDEDRFTEYPAPPRWVDVDVLTGLDRHVLRLLGNAFADAAERVAAGSGQRADHRAIHAARAITSPVGGRRPPDQPGIAYYPDDSAPEPNPNLLTLDDGAPF